MKKFLVLYYMPYAGMQEWIAKPEAERKGAEDQMKAEWDTWAAANAASIIETAGAGAMTLVTKDGVTEGHNDIMMYSLVQAVNKEAVTAMFTGHPHFGIPDATIQIMEANLLPGMQS
jgi:hypothetical protein